MDRPFRASASVFRNDGATVRLLAIMDDSRELVQRADLKRIIVTLYHVGSTLKAVTSWRASIEEALTDGPVYHQQDPGWPHPRLPYNFKWELPSGYTSKASGKYRLVFEFIGVGRRKATEVVDIAVRAPGAHA